MLAKQPTVLRAGRLRDQVCDLVARDIRDGFLGPGQRLLEVPLSERYGVSRTPVREALIKLQREGVIEAADRGYIVLRPDRKGDRDRLFVRQLLDPEVARRAACDADAGGIEDLRALLRRQEDADEQGDAVAFAEANEAFRNAVRLMCANTVLANSAAAVDEQFRAGRDEIHRNRANRGRTLRQSRDLFEAIANRQPEAAASTVRAFLDVLLAEVERAAG